MFNRDYSVGTKDLQYATISSNGTESSTAISIPPLGIKATITYVDGTTAGPTIFALTEGVSARQTTTGTSPPTLPTTTTLSTPLTISTTPCNLVVYGYTVTPCQALTSWYVDWYAGDKHLGGTRSSAPTTQRSHGLRDNGWLGAPTRAKVTYTLVDGSTTSPVFVPFDANANETVAAPFATAPLVRLTPTTLAAGATVPPTTLPPIKATSVQATVRPDSTTRCNVDNNTISIGFCKRIGSYVVVFLGLSGEISRVQKRIDNGWATALFLKDLGRPRGVAGLQILVTFTDGTTADVTFDDPWNARGFKTVPVLGQPRPPDACTLSLALGDVLVCRSFTSYTYRWWSADAPLSSVTNKYGVGYRIDLPEPPVGTTRVEVTAQLDDKTAITSTFIPYARP
jgi:hypothetical protein